MVKLPTRFKLPFDYWVKVRVLSDVEMNSVLDSPDCDGLWDIDTRTIYLRGSLGDAQKIQVFTHEVAHAVNDWEHHILTTGRFRS